MMKRKTFYVYLCNFAFTDTFHIVLPICNESIWEGKLFESIEKGVPFEAI